MISYLIFFMSYIFVAQIHAQPSDWPKSHTNTYEVLGGTDLGVVIPVADYQFKGRSQSSDPIVWLNRYVHIENPRNEFTLIFDPLESACDVEFFAKWCLVNDNFMDMPDVLRLAKVQRSESLMVGKAKDIPAMRLVFEYKDSIVDQLFLTVRNYGYCILATYPIEDSSSKSSYWDSFYRNTLPYIERVDGP
ncbi:MAG TPA: hypothetical protein VJL87_05295 [Bdellovibrionota bacterium]|nr:hypothetical protein [Bdellovibrionota bacterium]